MNPETKTMLTLCLRTKLPTFRLTTVVNPITHGFSILFLSSITMGRPGPFLRHFPHCGSYLQEGGASCLGVVGSLVLPLPPFSLIEAGAGARDAVTWGQMGAILQLGLHKTNPSKGFWSFLGSSPKQEILWGTVLKQ